MSWIRHPVRVRRTLADETGCLLPVLSTAKLRSPLVAKKKSPPLGVLITCAASGVRRCGRRGCSSGGVVRAG